MIPVAREAAEAEIGDICAAYDRIDPELGDSFMAEIDAAIERICEHPLAYQIVHADMRRVRLHRFPHALYYRVIGKAVVIVACMHPSQDPATWMSRR